MVTLPTTTMMAMTILPASSQVEAIKAKTWFPSDFLPDVAKDPEKPIKTVRFNIGGQVSARKSFECGTEWMIQVHVCREEIYLWEKHSIQQSNVKPHLIKPLRWLILL
jgi:hypothetical protein